MSYRSLKRVLGETSLERKFLVLFGASLLFSHRRQLLLVWPRTEKLVYDASRETARSLVETIIRMQHRAWSKTKTTRSRATPTRTSTTTWKKAWPAREYRWEFLRPVQEGRSMPRDNFEWDVVKKFPQSVHPDDGKPVTREWLTQLATREFEERREVVNKKPEYQFYAPVRINELQLHYLPRGSELNLQVAGTDRRKLGDLVSVVKVCHARREVAQEALNWNNAILLATAIITVFLAMLGLAT